jgi:hypothetical protein
VRKPNRTLFITVLISNALLFTGCLFLDSDKSKDIGVIATSKSPNQKYVATSYSESGGGAAGFCYLLINLRKTEERFNPDKGVVFETGCSQRSDELEFRWENDTRLRVGYPGDFEPRRKEQMWDSDYPVEIFYVSK